MVRGCGKDELTHPLASFVAVCLASSIIIMLIIVVCAPLTMCWCVQCLSARHASRDRKLLVDAACIWRVIVPKSRHNVRVQMLYRQWCTHQLACQAARASCVWHGRGRRSTYCAAWARLYTSVRSALASGRCALAHRRRKRGERRGQAGRHSLLCG